MIAGHITVSWPEGMKGVAVIAYEKSGGSSVRDTVTATEIATTAAAEIVTAIGIVTVVGIVIVIEIMTVVGIVAVIETAIVTEIMTATENTATAIAITKIVESRIRFSYSAI